MWLPSKYIEIETYDHVTYQTKHRKAVVSYQTLWLSLSTRRYLIYEIFMSVLIDNATNIYGNSRVNEGNLKCILNLN